VRARLPPKRVLAGVTAAIAVAGGVWAAFALWDSSTVPADLRLPSLKASDYFSASDLRRASSFQSFLRIDAVLAHVALVGALVVYAGRGERLVRESAAGRIGTGFLLGMLGFAVVWLAQLPFGLAQQIWEHEHGISKVGYLDWAVSDWLGLGGKFIFVCLALLIAMGFAGLTRRFWWLAAAPAFVGLVALATFLGPYLQPNLRDLQGSGLKADAASIARREGVPGVRVRVQDVHRDTTQPNAEATGLGPTRTVILWDTLFDQHFRRRELDAIMAHEYGHIAHRHLVKEIGWSALFGFPLALVVALATRRRGGMYEPRAVPLALLIFVLVQLAFLPAHNMISRHLEAEADWASLQTTRDPTAVTSLFVKLARVSRAEPREPGWAKLWFADHPQIIDRIATARAWHDRQKH
jgi:STE24 endopeptidase